MFFLQTNGSGVLSFAGVSASAGQVIQVLSTTKLDTFTSASTSLVDITGLSVTITPSSASNKIFVIVSLMVGNDANIKSFTALIRGSTQIGGGTASGSRPSRLNATSNYDNSLNDVFYCGGTFLDSPATTSATTYKMQLATVTGGGAVIGRSGIDGDNANTPRFASTITVMEIKG